MIGVGEVNKKNDSIWERDGEIDENVPYTIQTRRLTKVFGHRKAAVNNLNLDVPKGSIFGFLGPNGAGKTTTNKLLLGMVHPSAGESSPGWWSRPPWRPVSSC